jgi:hypothetical protein
MVILLAYDNCFNTNIITRNTLKEVKLELQEVNRGVKELKNDSAVQKTHEKGESLTASHPQLIHACIDNERRKFLQWMNPVFCDDKHGICHGQRNLETGRWIFQTDEYKTWNISDHAFLWLNGHRKLYNSPIIASR